VVPLVKAAAMVERNGDDYAVYLKRVFADDPDFQRASDAWAEEEVQHGDALGRWAMLADPAGTTAPRSSATARATRSTRRWTPPSAAAAPGELIARCMVETGTSSYYTALGDATEEPVLKQVCRLIAADEYRHFKLFYDHMKRYLSREELSFLKRLRVAAGASASRRTTSWPSPTIAATSAGRRLRPRPLHRQLRGPRHGLLPLPAHRARHGHDLQVDRPGAARAHVRPRRARRVAAAAMAAGPLPRERCAERLRAPAMAA
jgi:hypothetical protein